MDNEKENNVKHFLDLIQKSRKGKFKGSLKMFFVTKRKNMTTLDLMQQQNKMVSKLLEDQSKLPHILEKAKRQVERLKRKK